MEPNESGLSSYYHQPQPQPQPPQPQPQPQHQQPQNPSSTNGILPNNTGPHMVYPHSVPQAVNVTPAALESVKRKRGRPRKYATPEEAAAAKKLAPPSVSAYKKKDHSFSGAGVSSSTSSYKKPNFAAHIGNAGPGFTPHIITVPTGEDVGQKIMVFMQQSKCELCILSASGSVSNASLRQPATSGGNISYEGRLDILSLCGSYVRTEHGGRTGGLSVCLSSADGQILGGAVGGPLTAAGPVQVIVGTFLIDNKKDAAAGIKVDAPASMFPSPVPNANFISAIDSSGRIVVGGSEDQQNIGANPFMVQHRGMDRSMDWRTGTDTRNNVGYDFGGRMHEADQSPENGEYEPLSDRD